MKKFRTRNYNKVKIIILLIIFLLIFITLSFFKLTKSFTNIINITLKGFNYQDNNSIFIFSSNLDYLINNYSFKEKNNNYIKEENKIYLYNSDNNQEYYDDSNITDARKLLKNKLIKLGIKVLDEKEKNIDYLIDIERDNVKDTTITINNKKYAKILFVLNNNREILKKMNNYLNTNYPGISRGIYEIKDDINNQIEKNVIVIKIGGIENNINEVDNSTEILSLMLYHMLGEINEKIT